MTAPDRPRRAGPATDAQARWRDLVDRRLPEAARARPDWPVRLDHCFARILLDNACGGPWRERVAPPAWANMPPERLAAAADLGEAVLAGRADLALLNRRSLGWRGKGKAPAVPDALREGGLTLRRWRRADDAPFAALNADPEVMRHFPATKTPAESLWEARSLDRRFEADGFGPWALELPGEPFLGFVGAMRLVRPLPFAGGERPGACVEIGWRLARAGWGRGLATRAARLALGDLFGRCGIGDVLAFTAAGNAASRRVMERLGMHRGVAEDFDHPALPEGNPLRRHVLYRLSAAEFRAANGAAA
ncbi:GNAT family N-acetyltransferase [Methylobacterium segetis]|uniref:GNAT family N-acetyltransferase n=1 Tax=Methylobacterium segetis TaxID=2488750 RepID=UPI0010494DB0|nr:GNAT family N-acetyltransferase [Methylobacterium segetis]